jgi:soluble lytic murein transglycosylase
MRGFRATLLVCAFASLLVPAIAVAQVEVKTSAEGRTMIHNENDAQRGRRLSTRLVEPPQADLLPLIERHAFARGLDPRLVRAVVQAESGYNRYAVSVKGAQGLMQLMPETARELAVEDPFDPSDNLRGGTEYLYRMIQRFDGRIEHALAAYNAGPGAVERYGGVPPYRETRDYVARVLALWDGTPAALPGQGPNEPASSVRFASWPPRDGAAGGDLRPAGERPLLPARPVGWRRGGERPHLTNIDRRDEH